MTGYMQVTQTNDKAHGEGSKPTQANIHVKSLPESSDYINAKFNICTKLR
jgi:hypothetical protein